MGSRSCAAASALALLAGCGGGEEPPVSRAEAARCLEDGGGVIARAVNPYGLAALDLPVLEVSHPRYPHPRQVLTRIFFAPSRGEAEASRRAFVEWLRTLVGSDEVPDTWFDEHVAIVGTAVLDFGGEPTRATRALLERCLEPG